MVESPYGKAIRQRENFPEFTDEEFITYSTDIAMMVYNGDLTTEDMESVLDGEISLMEIMDKRGI